MSFCHWAKWEWRKSPTITAVLSVMQSAIPHAGFYIYPGFGLGPKPTSEQCNAAMPAYMKKYEQSPHGILIYNPPSGPFNFGKLLAREGTLNLLEGLLAACLLSWAAAGILLSITTNVEYWNWYEFPGAYIAGYMATQIIGYVLVGLVVAAFVKSEIAARS
jgi:hypothetical protein